MTSVRKVVFNIDGIYHIFNRGVERRPTFTKTNEYKRALNLVSFYQYAHTPIRFSQFLQQPFERQKQILQVMADSGKQVELLAYCLMPNHFHFLIRQTKENGIPLFISNFTNAYTKYFNTKYDRVGPLFQGTFKAVPVESEEQLLHLSRYIHLNPYTSSLIKLENLEKYEWSSYPLYVADSQSGLINKELVLSFFKGSDEYKRFVLDHADYAHKLEIIKHLTLD